MAVVTGGAAASAQPPALLPGRGVEVFAGLLNFHGLKPATVGDFARAAPAGRVLVVVGVVPPRNPQFDALARDTLAGGGSVLWAVDRGLDLGAVLNDRTRVTVSDSAAAVPPGSECLNGRLDSPFVTPRPPSDAVRLLGAAGLPLPPDPAAGLLDGLKRVATQSPGVITLSPGGAYLWRPLADLPPGTTALGAPARARREAVAVAASSGPAARPHRALVVSNSRALSNQLLAAEGTDNLAFANNLVVWLAAGGSRTACLLVANGSAVPRFDHVTFGETPPVPPVPPAPPLPDFLDPAVQSKLTALANETLGKLENDNAFNRLLTGDLDKPNRLRDVLKSLAVALGAVAVALVTRRLLGAKHAADHTPVARDPARPGTADGAAKQREEVLHRGDYLPLVAEYLRGWFAGCGAAAEGALPEIAVRRGVPDKPLRDALRILWGVATDAPAGRAARRGAPYSRWKQLEPLIHAVQAAHGAGDWRFAAPKEPA